MSEDATPHTTDEAAGTPKPTTVHSTKDSAPSTTGPAMDRYDAFTRIAIAGANQLRAHLEMDEFHYSVLDIEAQPDAKQFFLYRCLDHVQSAGIALLPWSDQLRAEAGAPAEINEGDRLNVTTRLVSENFAAEGALWSRRMIETLCHLICFATTNEEPYFRHWLLLNKLRDALFAKRDYNDYFGCDSKQVQSHIDRIQARIAETEKEVSLPRCWYLQSKTALPVDPKPAKLLQSFGTLLKIAVRSASPIEKLLLGLSYEIFSELSRDIHFTGLPPMYESATSTLAQSFTHCSLLTQGSLLRIMSVAGVTPLAPPCGQLARLAAQPSFGARVAGRLTASKAAVGDIVVAHGALCQVKEVKTSPFGYESYLVTYLLDAPDPSIGEDWTLPKHLHRLFTMTTLLEKVKQRLHAQGHSVSDDAVNPQDLVDAAKDAWVLGMRDAVLKRRPDERTLHDTGGPTGDS
jgi:hypothetical protein